MHDVDLKAASRTRLQTVSFSLILLLAFACGGSTGSADRAATSQEDDLARRRATMVEDQLLARGIRDKRVLEAMRTVRRHRYVPGLDATHAYDDRPYPIGEGQTISQPYIVALMSELANLDPPCRVLEIGTVLGNSGAQDPRRRRLRGSRPNANRRWLRGLAGAGALRCGRRDGRGPSRSPAATRPTAHRGSPRNSGRRLPAGARSPYAAQRRVQTQEDRRRTIRADAGGSSRGALVGSRMSAIRMGQVDPHAASNIDGFLWMGTASG